MTLDFGLGHDFITWEQLDALGSVFEGRGPRAQQSL